MKTRFTATLVLVLGALAGCGGGADEADRAIAKLAALTDKLCACKDTRCAAEVEKELARMPEQSREPTKQQMAKAMKVAERLAGCMKVIMEREAAAPTTVEANPPEPAAPPPSAPATP